MKYLKILGLALLLIVAGCKDGKEKSFIKYNNDFFGDFVKGLPRDEINYTKAVVYENGEEKYLLQKEYDKKGRIIKDNNILGYGQEYEELYIGDYNAYVIYAGIYEVDIFRRMMIKRESNVEISYNSKGQIYEIKGKYGNNNDIEKREYNRKGLLEKIELHENDVKHILNYRYNEDKKLDKIVVNSQYKENNEEWEFCSIEYSDNSKNKKITRSNHAIEYYYNEKDLIEKIKHDKYVREYIYDEKERLIEMKYNDNYWDKIKIFYNENNMILQFEIFIKDEIANYINCEYNESKQLSKLMFTDKNSIELKRIEYVY